MSELNQIQNHCQQRRQRLREVIRREEVDAFLVTGEKNVRYLTDFSGDSTYLFISESNEVLISDFRYTTQLAEECPGIDTFIRTSKTTLIDATKEVVADNSGVKRVGVESHLVSAELLTSMTNALEGTELVQLSWEIERLRAVKDDLEIAEIREAVRLAERGFQFLQAILTPEATELELSFELEHAVRKFGGAGLSFHPILAVGDRAALPHYRPSANKLSGSPILLCDWGAQTRAGYKSDLTRTMLTAPFEAKFEQVYKTVLEAQLRAIAEIGPGKSCQKIDAAARDYIREQGFGDYFDHGLGHGIGLDIHELPRLSQSSDGLLEPGMVVTVEPGIYLPGWGGVRIEDDVLVTENGCEVLSSVPKDWETVSVTI